MMSPLAVAAMQGLPPTYIGAGSGVFNASRQIGATLGAAVIATVMTAQFKTQIAAHARGSRREPEKGRREHRLPAAGIRPRCAGLRPHRRLGRHGQRPAVAGGGDGDRGGHGAARAQSRAQGVTGRGTTGTGTARVGRRRHGETPAQDGPDGGLSGIDAPSVGGRPLIGRHAAVRGTVTPAGVASCPRRRPVRGADRAPGSPGPRQAWACCCWCRSSELFTPSICLSYSRASLTGGDDGRTGDRWRGTAALRVPAAPFPLPTGVCFLRTHTRGVRSVRPPRGASACCKGTGRDVRPTAGFGTGHRPGSSGCGAGAAAGVRPGPPHSAPSGSHTAAAAPRPGSTGPCPSTSPRGREMVDTAVHRAPHPDPAARRPVDPERHRTALRHQRLSRLDGERRRRAVQPQTLGETHRQCAPQHPPAEPVLTRRRGVGADQQQSAVRIREQQPVMACVRDLQQRRDLPAPCQIHHHRLGGPPSGGVRSRASIRPARSSHTPPEQRPGS